MTGIGRSPWRALRGIFQTLFAAAPRKFLRGEGPTSKQILLKNPRNASTGSMNGKISMEFNHSSVRPEALEG